MKLGISEILEKASKLNPAERVQFLRSHDSPALRQILQFAFDKRIEWALPPGRPPYKKSDLLDQEAMLYSEMKKMYLFLKGGNPNLKQIRREFLFLQLLESLNPADSELLLSVKDHEMPFIEITEDLVREAFPNCLTFPKQEVVPPPQPIPVMETIPELVEIKETKKKKPKKEKEQI